MSQSIDPTLRAYLQARIQEWISADDHTAKDLAKAAGVSPAQISDAVNKGQIGWKTMMGVLPVFGLTLSTLEIAAQRWAAERPPTEIAPASQRRGVPRLQNRPEWMAIASATGAEHGELDGEDIAAVGRLQDEPTVFVGALDVPTVAGLAAVLGARRRRLARRRTT